MSQKEHLRVSLISLGDVFKLVDEVKVWGAYYRNELYYGIIQKKKLPVWIGKDIDSIMDFFLFSINPNYEIRVNSYHRYKDTIWRDPALLFSTDCMFQASGRIFRPIYETAQLESRRANMKRKQDYEMGLRRRVEDIFKNS